MPHPSWIANAESPPVAAAEARATAPLRVSDAAGSALGTITETVLVRRLGLGQADFFTTRADEIMSRSFESCAPEDLLSDVLANMHAHGLIFVLLVDAEHKVRCWPQATTRPC